MEEKSWEANISIFCHLSEETRTVLHNKAVAALVPGGLFILEAYTPVQLKYCSGGPRVKELLMNLAELKLEPVGLEFEHALKTEREVLEGSLHTGQAAVVQLIARKSVLII